MILRNEHDQSLAPDAILVVYFDDEGVAERAAQNFVSAQQYVTFVLLSKKSDRLDALLPSLEEENK